MPDARPLAIEFPWLGPLPPPFALWRMVTVDALPRCVCAIVELGVPELLAAGVETAGELAERTGTKSEALLRVLRYLASFGILTQTTDDRFGLSPLGEYLRAEVPGSIRPAVLYWGAPWRRRGAAEVVEVLRTGRPGTEIVNGAVFFDYLETHPDDARNFAEMMAALGAARNEAVASAYDFAAAKVVVDVGGGTGALLGAILSRSPGMRGILLDQPSLEEEAEAYLRSLGLWDRVEFVGGSFFALVPPGGDLYVLSWILHDWPDERAVEILEMCRRAMRADARLLVIEQIVAPGDEPQLAKASDIEMLTVVGGKERTEAEFAVLFGAAGLRLERVIETGAPQVILEAVPA